MLKTLAAALALGTLSGQALALSAGDIAFTSFNADEDGFSIVTFVDIAANTTVYFNDNEWNGSAFNAGEGNFTWDSGAAVVAAGTVIRFSSVDQAGRSVSHGSLVGAGDNGINATNETIYAFLGSDPSTPTTFLAGVSSEGSTNLTPAGLTGGMDAVILTNSTDYAEYTGIRSGETAFSAYRTLVNDSSNWNILVGGTQATQVPNTTAFEITPVPEPSTYGMLAAGLLSMGLILRSRRRR